MTTPTALFHAYLRPSVLQILRATGYHGTSPAVLDTVTDLAARYLSLLCEKTAARADHHYGDAGDFTLVEIRLALEEAGALLPQTVATEQEWRGQEDVRGVEEFVRWFTGPRMREIMEFAKGDGETDDMDYLNALKKRHNKTSDDSKFQGTILGKPSDFGEIEIEGGGNIRSIEDWIRQRSPGLSQSDSSTPQVNGNKGAAHSPSGSSNLSSVGDRLDEEGLDGMDMT